MSRPSQCLALSDAGPTPRECSPTLCARGPPASRARIRGWKRHWPWAPGLRLEGERPGDASRSGRGAEAGRPGARLRAPPPAVGRQLEAERAPLLLSFPAIFSSPRAAQASGSGDTNGSLVTFLNGSAPEKVRVPSPRCLMRAGSVARGHAGMRVIKDGP